jgi:hypothetical protein
MSRAAETLSRIRDRIAIGELPNRHADRLFIGCGDGCVCDGCGQIIDERSLEYQFEAALAAGSRQLRFHDGCFELWEMQTDEYSIR